MRREQLEHIIRAAADLTNETDFIIIGSQAILGRHPNAPAPLLVSMEADIYARNRPDLSDDIDGNLGRGSRFDQTFGYHADGVSPTTATLIARVQKRVEEGGHDVPANAIIRRWTAAQDNLLNRGGANTGSMT